MPLISLNAAQRSTFHTHISNSDPSSCARHIPSSAAEGMQGEAAGQGPIYMELIFCFMGRFLELRRSGLERAGGMCQVYDQAAACMHDLRYTYTGRPFFTRSHGKREKRSEPRLRGRWARCCPLMQSGEVGHSTKWTSGAQPEGISDLWHFIQM